MKLELISRLPRKAAKPTPLLFLHGSNSGAWVWDEHFLAWFAERGYAAHALSLRGHGGSEGYDWLSVTSLRDYVADLVRTLGQFERPPVLIGHSMGGMVIQKYLEWHNSVPGVVLMASVPPQGLVMASTAMALRDPFLFQHTCLVQTIGPLHPWAYETVRRILFSDDMPKERVCDFYRRWQPESQRVVLDMCGYDLPKRNGNNPPVLVMGGKDDAMVPWPLIQSTASYYGTAATLVPDIAHAMMLDSRWEKAAEALLGWIETGMEAN